MNSSNHDWLDNTSFSDDIWLSMLVDGELSESQRQKYLDYVKQADNWQKVAAAFLDEQILGGHVGAPTETESTTSVADSEGRLPVRRWTSYFAMAACLVIGLLTGPWLYNSPSSVAVVDVPAPSVEVDASGVDGPGVEVADNDAGDEVAQPTFTPSLPGLYQVRETIDEAVYYADFSLPQFMLDALVLAGHRVTFDQEFLGYTETSDNPAAVPINVIHIQKYGRLLAAVE